LIRILIQIERTGVICRARKRARNIALFHSSKFCNGLQHGCRKCQGNVAETTVAISAECVTHQTCDSA